MPKTNIEQLTDLIIQEKRLTFPISELVINDELVQSGVLGKYKQDFVVKDFKAITPLILEIYKEKLNFEIQDDFKENVAFLQNVTSDFLSNGFVPYFRKLSKHLLEELIIESNQLHNCSFVEYINYLEETKDRESIFSFIDSYQSVMIGLQLSTKDYYTNVIKLLELSASDADFNSPQANILRSVRVKCRNETVFAYDLFHFSFQEEKYDVKFQANIIAALYETERITFFNNHLKVKLENRQNESAILWGLAFVYNPTETDCTLFIEIYKEKHHMTTLSIPSLALLFSIVRTPFIQFYDFCFNGFNNSLENEANSQYLIKELWNLDNFSAEKFEFIKNLIRREYFKTEIHLDDLRVFLDQIGTFESFQSIHAKLIERFPSTKFAEVFQTIMLSYDPITSDKYLIDLLSDNRPEMRYAGLDIFEQLSASTPYKFKYDIKNLPYQTQVKLFRALFYRDADPNFFLPALIPFLEQEDEEAKELFIRQLERSALDYPSEVLKVLNKYLDKSKSGYLIERIKEYVEEYFTQNVDPKNEIIEFNPLQTQLEFIRLFNTLLAKKFKKMLHENMKAHKGVLGLFSKNEIYLAKGGGYRIENKQPISKLNKFSKGTSFARSSLYNPTNFEFDRFVISKINWDKLSE